MLRDLHLAQNCRPLISSSVASSVKGNSLLPAVEALLFPYFRLVEKCDCVPTRCEARCDFGVCTTRTSSSTPFREGWATWGERRRDYERHDSSVSRRSQGMRIRVVAVTARNVMRCCCDVQRGRVPADLCGAAGASPRPRRLRFKTRSPFGDIRYVLQCRERLSVVVG
jgi:hypothetical protein